MPHIGDRRYLDEEIVKHSQLKAGSLSLLPTENVLSPWASKLLATDLVNRYAPPPSSPKMEYPDTAHMDAVEELCTSVLARLFGAASVNVRPLSGLNAMMICGAALSTLGDTVYTLDPADGGHACTAGIFTRLGARVHALPLDSIELQIDFERCRDLFKRNAPKLVYFDHTNVLFPLGIGELRKIIPAETVIYYDCSQILGLMLDPSYFNPLCGERTAAGGSTHKTFPGPQKAIIFSNDANIMKVIQDVADTFVSSHHINSVAALAATAVEMSSYGLTYARQILENARSLGEALIAQGLPVHQARGVATGSHQVWINKAPADDTPELAVNRLSEAGLVVNYSRLPSLKGGMGMRLGSTGVTRLGMGPAQMREIGRLMADVVLRRRAAEQVRSEVVELRASFKTARYCFDSSFDSDRKVGCQPATKAAE